MKLRLLSPFLPRFKPMTAPSPWLFGLSKPLDPYDDDRR
jgi:hypothetical protein